MSEYCADALVLMDSMNAFKSHMRIEEVERINACGGIPNAETVNLWESKERPIPSCLKYGESIIKDVLVVMQPNISICLN